MQERFKDIRPKSVKQLFFINILNRLCMLIIIILVLQVRTASFIKFSLLRSREPLKKDKHLINTEQYVHF